MQVEARISKNPEAESQFKTALVIQKMKQTFPEMECY